MNIKLKFLVFFLLVLPCYGFNQTYMDSVEIIKICMANAAERSLVDLPVSLKYSDDKFIIKMRQENAVLVKNEEEHFNDGYCTWLVLDRIFMNDSKAEVEFLIPWCNYYDKTETKKIKYSLIQENGKWRIE